MVEVELGVVSLVGSPVVVVVSAVVVMMVLVEVGVVV